MSETKESEIGVGVTAAFSVAVANTVHTLTHPIHAARVILGLEKEKGISEMVHDEEIRIVTRSKEK